MIFKFSWVILLISSDEFTISNIRVFTKLVKLIYVSILKLLIVLTMEQVE